jgi:hypothetical protein
MTFVVADQLASTTSRVRATVGRHGAQEFLRSKSEGSPTSAKAPK